MFAYHRAWKKTRVVGGLFVGGGQISRKYFQVNSSECVVITIGTTIRKILSNISINGLDKA